MQRFAPLIEAVVVAVAQPQQRAGLEAALAGAEGDAANLVAAIRRIWAGERDVEALCEPLDYGNSLVVETTRSGLNPENFLMFGPFDVGLWRAHRQLSQG